MSRFKYFLWITISCLTVLGHAHAAPLVLISTPTNNQKVEGTVTVQVQVSTQISIASVDVLIDTYTYSASAQNNTSVSWPTQSTYDGSHTLRARVIDRLGFKHDSPFVTVRTDNSPLVLIQVVKEGEVVKGRLVLSGRVYQGPVIGPDSLPYPQSSPSPEPIDIDVEVGGQRFHSQNYDSYWSFSLDTKKIADGLTTMVVRAIDSAGHIGTAIRSFIVRNTPSVSKVTTEKTPTGWMLKVDGSRFVVKGVAYIPARIGQDPNIQNLQDWMVEDDNHNGKIDAPYDSYIDANKNNAQDIDEPTVGDFQLMKEMGVNTIRVYHHASTAAAVVPGYSNNQGNLLQYNHPPNKELLRDLYKTYGIRVAMGDFLGAYVIGSGVPYSAGTDYRSASQRAQIQKSVEQMVMDFKDEPFLLMYVLGNENFYSFTQTNAGTYPAVFAKFVDDMAVRIHELDPNHPVAICNADTQQLSALITSAPHIDIFGVNAYRGSNFGNLWRDAARYNKPVLITEYGVRPPPVSQNKLNETSQAATHRSNWLDIQANLAGGTGFNNAIGGIAFEWLDTWWRNGIARSHNDIGNGEEWHGLFGQGTGGTPTTSPFLREKRLVYDMYKQLWTGVQAASIAIPGDQPILPAPALQQVRLNTALIRSRRNEILKITDLPSGSNVEISNPFGQVLWSRSDVSGSLEWNGTDNGGSALPMDVYILSVEANGERLIKKIAVVR